MTEFTLEKLIPIAGERMDFMENLAQYKKSQKVRIKNIYICIFKCYNNVK